MALTYRLLDGAGRELRSHRVSVPGQNLGFPPVQTRASLNRRIEPLIVAEGAKSLEIIFDSGTWNPELTGEWIIAEVTVNRSSQTFGPQESIWKNPLLEPLDPNARDNVPQLWDRYGDPSIARLEKRSADYLLALRDFSKTAAGAWASRQTGHSRRRANRAFSPGKRSPEPAR